MTPASNTMITDHTYKPLELQFIWATFPKTIPS